MYRIQLLRKGQIVETVKSSVAEMSEIVDQATELEQRHKANDWEVVNGLGQRVVTKTRWRDVNGGY